MSAEVRGKDAVREGAAERLALAEKSLRDAFRAVQQNDSNTNRAWYNSAKGEYVAAKLAATMASLL